MNITKFNKKFNQPSDISTDIIDKITDTLKSGELFRYNKKFSYAKLFEKNLSLMFGVKYVLCVNSCGSALHLSLKTFNLDKNDIVLMNEFSLSPVVSAINNIGCKVEYVKINKNLIIDTNDLLSKIKKFKPKILLLSHMRSFFPKMDEIKKICDLNNVKIIEDAAHTMGIKYKDKYIGTWGEIGCFSLQSYKQINAGEGGIIMTDNPEIFSKLIILSGSYMYFKEHDLKPDDKYFKNLIYNIPNYSSRFNEIAAIIANSQLNDLLKNNSSRNKKYLFFRKLLDKNEIIEFPNLVDFYNFSPTSILFYLNLSYYKIIKFVNECKKMNVIVNYFGYSEPKGFTSNVNQIGRAHV